MTSTLTRFTTTQRKELRAQLAADLARDGLAVVCNWPGCEESNGLEVDHRVSLANGGSNSLDNLQLLCREHNAAKGASAVILSDAEQCDGWREQVSSEGRETFEEIVATFQRYLWHADASAYELMALTVMAAADGLRDSLEHLPIVNVTASGPGAGKSVAVTIIKALLPGATMSEGMSSVGALLRLKPSTVIIDEAQSAKLTRDEARRWLNSSHSFMGAEIINLPKADGGWEPTEFETFAAVFLAGIATPLSQDTRSRSITVTMQPAPVGVKPAKITRSTAGKLEALGAKLESWALDAKHCLASEEDTEAPGITGRRADVWASLFRVADLLGADHYAKAVSIAEAHESQARALVQPTLVEMLRADLADLVTKPETEQVGNAEGHIKSTDLVTMLVTQYEDPWASMGGRSLTAERLGPLMQQLGISKSTQSKHGNQRPRGYYLADIRRVVLPKE